MASTFTKLLFHVVFSTKNRDPLIGERVREELYGYIGGVIRGEGGALVATGGMPDHVHLLVRLRAQVSVAETVRKVKSCSSKWMSERGSGGKFSWQTGYGAFTVSESQGPAVRRYLLSQEEHHRRRSFREELVEILERHGVEYGERYLLG